MTIPGTWQIERLAASLGAEVTGVDLKTSTPNDIQAIKNLLLDHMVLFFPDQSISPEPVSYTHLTLPTSDLV